MNWKGIRFYKVEAESKSDAAFTSVGVRLNIEKMELTAPNETRLDFTYSVDYRPNVASLKFEGYVVLDGMKPELEKLVSTWKKDKTLPKDVAEPLINIINFNAETNGVLVSKAINIVPPLLSPKMGMKLGKKA